MNQDAIREMMSKVVDDLIALVESSDGTWIQPWVNLGLGKQFRSTGEPYRGTNQMFLGLIAVSHGLGQPHIWAGYQTWLEMGYRVRKGEKSPYRPIYAYLVRTCATHGHRTEDGKCCPEMRRFVRTKLLKSVFHLSQVDPEPDTTQKLPTIPEVPVTAIEPHEVVGRWTEAGMTFVEVDSDRAYFSPVHDHINLPPLGAFSDEQGFYSTLFHEATHWTGHESRLNRPHGMMFGDPKYAQEELVAEIGSAMTGAAMGFEPTPHPEHGEYLKNWLGALKDDPTKLYEAAVEAEKASGLLLELGKVIEVAA